MKTLLNKAFAFVKRDFLIEAGYQVSFVMGIIESVMLLVIFHFLGELVVPRDRFSHPLWRRLLCFRCRRGGVFPLLRSHVEDVLRVDPERSSHRLP